MHNVILSKAVAKRWPHVQTGSLDPGWVKTKLGGSSAPGTIDAPGAMIAAFAAGESVAGEQTGVYLTPEGVGEPHDATKQSEKQDRLLEIYQEVSGVSLPN